MQEVFGILLDLMGYEDAFSKLGQIKNNVNQKAMPRKKGYSFLCV